MTEYKNHLAHPDQSTPRWIGDHKFTPGVGVVATRCGDAITPQPEGAPLSPGIDHEPNEDTCKSCARATKRDQLGAITLRLPEKLLPVLGALACIDHKTDPAMVLEEQIVPLLRRYAELPEVQLVLNADRRPDAMDIEKAAR